AAVGAPRAAAAHAAHTHSEPLAEPSRGAPQPGAIPRRRPPRALIQMATGSGKTMLAVTALYRLIKFGGARRVLFLVDRSNLGEQAEKEFANYRTPDDNRRFTELYNVQRLTTNTIGVSTKVAITTIQRLYSMLK